MMLKPLEVFYHWAGDIRNFLFRKNILKSRRLSVPVISVGNISFGGVGKTPFIVFLAEELAKDHSVNVIAKSYKGLLRSAELVDSAKTELYGDEACLLAQKLPQCKVWAGPVKWKAALLAQQNNEGIILVDDGFSHRGLARNFDLVLVDAMTGLSGYHRERISSLRRASAILITKANLAGADKTATLKKKLQSIVPDALIFLSESVSSLELRPQSELFVFCGLGNPKSFLRALEVQGYIIREKRFFRDHHRFTEHEQQQLLDTYLDARKRHPQLKLVCTEKDAVKISNAELRQHLAVVKHSLHMQPGDKEGLLAQIRHSL